MKVALEAHLFGRRFRRSRATALRRGHLGLTALAAYLRTVEPLANVTGMRPQ